MESIIKNWKNELKELRNYKNCLVKELIGSVTQERKTEIERIYYKVCGKIEVLEKCLKLEIF